MCIRDRFRSVSPEFLMDEEERTAHQALEDTVTVYRGVTPYNAHNIRALSWTLDRKTADKMCIRDRALPLPRESARICILLRLRWTSMQSMSSRTKTVCVSPVSYKHLCSTRKHSSFERDFKRNLQFQSSFVGKWKNRARKITGKLKRAQGECLGTGSRRKTG